MFEKNTIATACLIGSSMLSSPTAATSSFNSYVIPSSNSNRQIISSSSTKSEGISHAVKPSQFDKTEGELISYFDLTEGWDGEQGVAPSKDVLEYAITLLHYLKAHGYISPKPMLAASGEVALYWKTDNVYIEIGIEEENFFSYLTVLDDEPFGEDDIEFSFQDENEYSLTKWLPSNIISGLNKLAREISDERTITSSVTEYFSKTLDIYKSISII